MKVLAIETATEACSCALWLDGEQRCRYQVAPRRHAELLLEMVASLLAEAELSLQRLDGIAFGCGPGSFTGVRIAVAVSQGLAFGAELAVAPVSSLRALAEGARRELGCQAVLSALDARMSQVYWGSFRASVQGPMEAVGAERVCEPETVVVPNEELAWFGVGPGWGPYRERLAARLGRQLIGTASDRYPHALDVASLGAECLRGGEGVSPDEALPVYLRNRVTG